MSDKQAPVTGRKVLFIGGPEAGNVRMVPEAHGDHLKGENDWHYRIWPFQMQGSTDRIYFAYAADQHPMNMLIDLWREYAPVAQIKRNTDVVPTYNRVKSGP